MPENSLLIQAMACTHSLTLINSVVSGDPLDQVMLKSTGWVRTYVGIQWVRWDCTYDESLLYTDCSYFVALNRYWRNQEKIQHVMTSLCPEWWSQPLLKRFVVHFICLRRHWEEIFIWEVHIRSSLNIYPATNEWYTVHVHTQQVSNDLCIASTGLPPCEVGYFLIWPHHQCLVINYSNGKNVVAIVKPSGKPP